jgi:hypothetical protein
MSKVLNDRAKKRLRIAAALLRGVGKKPRDLGLSREHFYEDLQALIASLPEAERQSLKENTDWVEAYENEWDRLNPTTERKTK